MDTSEDDNSVYLRLYKNYLTEIESRNSGLSTHSRKKCWTACFKQQALTTLRSQCIEFSIPQSKWNWINKILDEMNADLSVYSD